MSESSGERRGFSIGFVSFLPLFFLFPERKVHTAIPGFMVLGQPREEFLLDEQQRHIRETWLLILCTSAVLFNNLEGVNR